jgi:AraC-like DNA-binding protein
MILYREHQPHGPLGQFVECFWTLQSDGTIDSTQTERILPDGCVELILNFGARFTQHTEDNQTLQPANFLVGQMTGPILISPTGPVQLIGIRFHPGGTTPFTRVPLHEVTDEVVALSDVATDLERQLLESSTDAPTLDKKIAAIEKTLTSLVMRSKITPRSVVLANQIVKSRGLLSIDALACSAGISARQLERTFLNDVGISPKLLSRILRFQQVFRAVEAHDNAWAPIAIDCGYYDQAHLIRDFNKFAHQTPAVFVSQQSELTQSFTRKARTSHFYNTHLPLSD